MPTEPMWSSRIDLLKLVTKWFRRSQGESLGKLDFFDRFVSLWISFIAWGKYESKKETDRNMIEWAKSHLKDKYSGLLNNDSEFKGTAQHFKNVSPIVRSKEYKGSDRVTITNIKNFDEIFEGIYVVRCNYFHGYKSPDNERDKTLIELSFKILSKLFSEVLHACI